MPGDRSYHEDCWNQVADEVVATASLDRQRDYEERIATQGLAALLSPYVSKVPEQRATVASESVPA